MSFAVEDLIDYKEEYFPDNNCIGLTEERVSVNNSGHYTQSPLANFEFDQEISGDPISEDSIEIELGPHPEIGRTSWTKTSESREVISKKKAKKAKKRLRVS